MEIVGIHETQKTVITGLEMFRKQLDFAESGDNIGALLRGIKMCIRDSEYTAIEKNRCSM